MSLNSSAWKSSSHVLNRHLFLKFTCVKMKYSTLYSADFSFPSLKNILGSALFSYWIIHWSYLCHRLTASLMNTSAFVTDCGFDECPLSVSLLRSAWCWFCWSYLEKLRTCRCRCRRCAQRGNRLEPAVLKCVMQLLFVNKSDPFSLQSKTAIVFWSPWCGSQSCHPFERQCSWRARIQTESADRIMLHCCSKKKLDF